MDLYSYICIYIHFLVSNTSIHAEINSSQRPYIFIFIYTQYYFSDVLRKYILHSQMCKLQYGSVCYYQICNAQNSNSVCLSICGVFTVVDVYIIKLNVQLIIIAVNVWILFAINGGPVFV